MKSKVDSNTSDRTIKDLIWLLFETSLLTSGFSLEEPTSFANRIHRMIKFALNVGDEEVEEEEELPELQETNEKDESEKRMEGID